MRRTVPLVIAGMVLAAGCGDNGGPLGLARAFKTPENAGCTYASPVVAAPGGDATVITATTEGVVAAYGIDGTARWQVTAAGACRVSRVDRCDPCGDR